MTAILSTGDWISLLFSLLSAGVAYGALRTKVAGLEERVKELATGNVRSNEDQGRRLGELEGWRKAVEAVDRERRRRPTSAAGLAAGEGKDDE